MIENSFIINVIITLFNHAMIFIIPTYLIIKIGLSIYFGSLKDIIKYILIGSICYVIYNILSISGYIDFVEGRINYVY